MARQRKFRGGMHARATPKQLEAQSTVCADQSASIAIAELRAAVDVRLGTLVAGADTAPLSLNRAVRHALMAPGKRIRPLLAMVTAAEFGTIPTAALDAGCAIELVHTASLILDDLPCMDDARMRRGMPATHAVFGEATAVLAAIAMMSRSFGVLAQMDGVSAQIRSDLVSILARASGADGLAAGQECDLNERALGDSLTKIDAINDLKTGALFIASTEMGGRIASVAPDCLAALSVVGREIGMAFQTLDDLIDLHRSTTEAGKDTGKDSGKATVVTVLGVEEARAEVNRHAMLAQAAISPFTSVNGVLRRFIAGMLGEVTTGAEALMVRRTQP